MKQATSLVTINTTTSEDDKNAKSTPGSNQLLNYAPCDDYVMSSSPGATLGPRERTPLESLDGTGALKTSSPRSTPPYEKHGLIQHAHFDDRNDTWTKHKLRFGSEPVLSESFL